MSINSLAAFDVLCLGKRLQRQIGGFTLADIQLLAYLSCLLSLYKGNPDSDWGYGFIGTELGSPFSPDIDSATRRFQEKGYLNGTEEKLQMTPAADSMLSILWNQNLYYSRKECLLAAGSSTLALPIGAVRDAMGQELELNRVKNINASRSLLDDQTSLGVIYEQFRDLRDALGKEYNDLRIPAIAWITALYQTSRPQGEATHA